MQAHFGIWTLGHDAQYNRNKLDLVLSIAILWRVFLITFVLVSRNVVIINCIQCLILATLELERLEALVIASRLLVQCFDELAELLYRVAVAFLLGWDKECLAEGGSEV